MTHSIAQLHSLLEALASTLHKPTEAGFSLAPALELLGAHLGATGGMLLKAEDMNNLRLAAHYGDTFEEETLSEEFLELTYSALFKYHRPALTVPGDGGYDGSVIGAPMKAGDRHIGGVFLLRGPDAPPFTAEDTDVLQLACLAMANQIDAIETARRTGARRAELEAVHASMVDGLVVIDRRGYISHFNEAFLRLSKIPSFELYGHRWLQLLEPRPHPSIDSAAELENFFDSLFAGDAYLTTGCPAFLKQPDGIRLPVTVGMASIEDNGRVTGGVLNLRDATVEAHLERLKDDFIATVSHELKTPLTTISGFVELVRNHELPRSEQIPLFDLILDEGQRLNRMIHDLLDLSKIQSGSLSLHLEKFAVARLVDQVVNPFVMRCKETHQFEVEVTPPNGTMVADRDRIVQILVNLVGNAVKYSPAGGKVKVAAHKIKHEWEFSVTDQGMGIPESALPRLFGRFFRVNEQQSTGSGLGLFITKNLVERHGGKISVQSKDGVGSTFTVRLPATTAEEKKEKIAR
jgi:signal transduction histidine kinase